ncbi:MAG TPA: hypothetical protein VGA73_02510 [Candidatus Binatia bacterium]
MKAIFYSIPVLLTALNLSGCQIVGDIFKAGVWVGVLLVVLVIGVIVWMVSRSGA